MPGSDDSAHARYARQLLLPEIGETGQRALADAAVLVVGAGGLGSPAISYLSAAGVGRIGIVDDDTVEASNLNRQVIHTTEDLGHRKTVSAANRARAINPQVEVTRYDARLSPQNAADLLPGYDIVVDCTDNFPARYLVSDACTVFGVPDVWAAVSGFDGAVSVFWRGHGPCYRCLHPRPPVPGTIPVGAAAGVLGPVPGVVGAMQAVEAIKLIAGAGNPLVGRIAMYDALGGSWRQLDVAPNPACPACGDRPALRSREDLAAAYPPEPPATTGEVGVSSTRPTRPALDSDAAGRPTARAAADPTAATNPPTAGRP